MAQVLGKDGNLLGEVPGDKVIVDVGSGDRPWPIANVLVDAKPEDDTDRSGKPPVKDGRMFLQADIQDLPFADKSVDFIIASHVVEHVEDPLAACQEMQRVSKAGVIICPSWEAESDGNANDPDNWKRHLWVANVYYPHSAIVFLEKPEQEDGRRQMPQIRPDKDVTSTTLVWQDEFSVEVVGKDMMRRLKRSADGPSLAVCMIVKDEALTLPACLASVAPIADEFVICDTGSSDNTLEVARQIVGERGKVIVHPRADEWRENPGAFDFSEARNFALEHVESDWVLSLDADETLDPTSLGPLRENIKQLPPEIRLILVDLVMQTDSGELEHVFWGERVIRRGVRFRGSQHNWVDVGADEKVRDERIRLLHNRRHRPGDLRKKRDEQRHAMADNHFRKAIAENPDDRRSMFYLASDLKDRGLHEEAVKWYCEYLNKSNWEPERYQAALFCARCLHLLNRKDEAKQILLNSLHDIWNRAEGYLLLGDLCYETNDIQQAEHWYLNAYRLERPIDPMFIEEDCYTWVPAHRLAHVKAQQGEEAECRRYGEEAIRKGAVHASFDTVPLEWLPPKHEGMPRMAVFVDRGQYNFIDPLLERWKETWDIKTTSEAAHIPELLEWADVAWFEWGGPLLVEASKYPKKCRMMVRVHGYEVHAGHLTQVNWRNMDDILFTASYLSSLTAQQIPVLQYFERRFLVPGGIEVAKYAIAEGKTGNKVAMACYLNYKKNLPLALQIFAKAKQTRPELELHIAGEWQDGRLQVYVGELIHQMKLKDVHFHEWQTDLNAWYADKDYYLSASIEESLQYSLAEAMACGLKPLIHCWLSSHDFYPPEHIFRTVDEAVEALATVPTAEERQGYRRWIEEHLNFETQLRRINRIIAKPRIAIEGELKEDWRIEPRLLQAFENIGCVRSKPKAAQMTLYCNPGYLERAQAPGKKVIWYAEQVVGQDDHAEKRRERLLKYLDLADAVLISHPQGKEALGLNGKAQTLFCGGAHWLFKPYEGEKEYDIGFYGTPSGRRKELLEQLSAAGHKTAIIESFNPREVAEFIGKCRALLNIHVTEEANVETRLAEAMSVGTLVISERLPEGSPFPKDTYWEWESFEELLAQVERLKAEPEAAAATAERGHYFAWKHLRLDQQAEKLLEAVGL